jgi:hypothetical protein
MLHRYPLPDRKVFARALLLHPSPSYRGLAREFLEPSDYWLVLSDPATPVPTLLQLWRHLRPAVGNGYLKIFFASVRDACLRGGGAEDIVATVELMKEFYGVDALHEDAYFELLQAMDEPVRRQAREHGLLVDFDAEYARLFRAFLAGGKRQEQRADGFGLVPLPVQRRLARRGHFLPHFICHPVDRIALECLPYLQARESVLEFVRVPQINSRLIGELARERRLFRHDEARLALVANPKTPANVVLQNIHHLPSHALRELMRSRDANAVARNYAARLLGRHG